jgi:hypothetical protein
MEHQESASSTDAFIAGLTRLIEAYAGRPEPGDEGVRFPLRRCFARASRVGGSGAAEVRIRDVSFRGLGLICPEPFESGETLLVEIPEANQRFVGVVAWCEPRPGDYLIGVQLIHPGRGPVGLP